MSKVNGSPEQSKPVSYKPTHPEEELFSFLDEPFKTLTDQKPYDYWKWFLMDEIEQAGKQVKPGMKASSKVYARLFYLNGLLQLLQRLHELRGIGTVTKDHLHFLYETIDGYKLMLDRAERNADQALEACKDWREMVYEDGPANKEYLSAANLAMRLQRPHKSN